MNYFLNLKDLITALNRGELLLSELFKKRKQGNYRYEYALDLLEGRENVIAFLIEKEIINENGDYLEINDEYLQFFELILNANEELNISYINENLNELRNTIDYYLNEINESGKNSYSRRIKQILRKIGRITFKNVIDLGRNVEDSFTHEPNYKNKIAKLQHLDEKRTYIEQLIRQTQNLIEEDEKTFFKTALDEEMNGIIIDLKDQMNKAMHHIVQIGNLIINYLNQVKEQSNLIEKLKKIKYLKDQYILDNSTNIREVLSRNNGLVFEPSPRYTLPISIDYLETDEEASICIQNVANRERLPVKVELEMAEKISEEFLIGSSEKLKLINFEHLKREFLAGSKHLFDFIIHYDFNEEKTIDERVTIFCQFASRFEKALQFTDEFRYLENIKYNIIKAK